MCVGVVVDVVVGFFPFLWNKMTTFFESLLIMQSDGHSKIEMSKAHSTTSVNATLTKTTNNTRQRNATLLSHLVLAC